MTTETIYCRPSKNAFAKAVANAKILGGVYDAATKTWAIKRSRIAANWPGKDAEEIIQRNYLVIVDQSAKADPATTWMGGRSMDAEDSIF
jgi:hypothetical protein